jgi:hypothetical protein
VLVDELGQGWISASIAFGEVLRYGRNTPYTQWTHCAIVYDVRGQDPAAIKIVEARASARVDTTYLSKYAGRYAIGHTEVGAYDWREVKLFLDSVLEKREPYDLLAWLWLSVYALTGTKVCLQRAGTATCSGLVADALTRIGIIWTRPPYAMTPADIAHDLPECPYAITSYVKDPSSMMVRRRLAPLVRLYRRAAGYPTLALRASGPIVPVDVSADSRL